MTEYQAFRVHQDNKVISSRLEKLTLTDPKEGEVLIRSAYSSINYKDALAATGKGKIIRRFPLTAGIDVSGKVEKSNDSRFKEGDSVIVTGFEFGTGHDGGYAEYATVPGDWVVKLPSLMSLYQAMAIGTAGFTVALAIQRMEDNGQSPDQGPFIVTGATGGVGSFAIDMLNSLGYHVVAVTGKPETHESLKKLGAKEILDRREINFDVPPLDKGQWGGAIDNVGGDMLGWLTKTTNPWGNIASIGLAGGHHLNTTVMPFILRGVNLLGITSSGCPARFRQPLWERLATDLAPKHLDDIVTAMVGLDGMEPVFNQMLDGVTSGRTVVEINPDI